jgi:hypothetical protein
VKEREEGNGSGMSMGWKRVTEGRREDDKCRNVTKNEDEETVTEGEEGSGRGMIMGPTSKRNIGEGRRRQRYCHESGVCVTNKTGFGFDDRNY